MKYPPLKKPTWRANRVRLGITEQMPLGLLAVHLNIRPSVILWPPILLVLIYLATTRYTRTPQGHTIVQLSWFPTSNNIQFCRFSPVMERVCRIFCFFLKCRRCFAPSRVFCFVLGRFCPLWGRWTAGCAGLVLDEGCQVLNKKSLIKRKWYIIFECCTLPFFSFNFFNWRLNGPLQLSVRW